MSGFTGDPHSEPGQACPKNYFSITDYSELQTIEAPLAAKRGSELIDIGAMGIFDAKHLKAIHKYLFQDIFPWAGEFRVVNISKGQTNFGRAMYIAGALDGLLAKLRNEELLVGLEPKTYASRAAYYLGEINAIHPFREGNGRTQRESIRQLAVQAGYQLSWAGFTQQEMVVASIASHAHGDYSLLAGILERALLAASA